MTDLKGVQKVYDQAVTKATEAGRLVMAQYLAERSASRPAVGSAAKRRAGRQTLGGGIGKLQGLAHVAPLFSTGPLSANPGDSLFSGNEFGQPAGVGPAFTQDDLRQASEKFGEAFRKSLDKVLGG